MITAILAAHNCHTGDMDAQGRLSTKQNDAAVARVIENYLQELLKSQAENINAGIATSICVMAQLAQATARAGLVPICKRVSLLNDEGTQTLSHTMLCHGGHFFWIEGRAYGVRQGAPAFRKPSQRSVLAHMNKLVPGKWIATDHGPFPFQTGLTMLGDERENMFSIQVAALALDGKTPQATGRRTALRL